MTKNRPPDPAKIPSISAEQIRATARRLGGAAREPLLAPGTVTKCHLCGGNVVTTNNLRKSIPTPQGLIVLLRLPGAECSACKAQSFDASAIATISEYSGLEVIADYETSVTRASGRTLGTYFKADLTRVLNLSGKESLRWVVLDRDHAYVEVERAG